MKPAYDEMLDSAGRVRPNYQGFAAWLESTPPEVIARKCEEADLCNYWRSRHEDPPVPGRVRAVRLAGASARSRCPRSRQRKGCANLKAKPKGDWSINEATDYAKHCIFK